MDKVTKFLRKLNRKERKTVEKIVKKVTIGDLTNLDVRKLKKYDDLFRVRKGTMRFIFQETENAVPPPPVEVSSSLVSSSSLN